MDAIEIVKNTAKIQAVYHSGLNILEAIFHEAGSLDFNGKTIMVDKPCSLILMNNTELTVSSPAQNETAVSVQLMVNGNSETLVVNLPTSADLKGSSVTSNFSSTLSVNPVKTKITDVKLFPNPTFGEFQITSKNDEQVQYMIVSVDGKVISQGQYSGSKTIDLSGYNSGIYLIRFRSQQATVTKKIIKY
jgi:chondroitin AC lyase